MPNRRDPKAHHELWKYARPFHPVSLKTQADVEAFLRSLSKKD